MHRRFPTLAVLVLVVAAALLSACASDGAFARGRMRTMVGKAPPEKPVKIVVLNVEAERGTAVAGEMTLADVRKAPGVLDADRGAGRNDVIVLVDLETDSSHIVDSLRPRYRVYVVGEYLREDL